MRMHSAEDEIELSRALAAVLRRNKYLGKPFVMEELYARIRTMKRRTWRMRRPGRS